MSEWWQKVAEDFSDLPNIGEALRMTVRLIFAAFLGGLLGYDRERAGKAAGLRTHMLVSLGAALFVLIPQQAGLSDTDISRVIQGVVAGVGFLGAGAIVKRTRGGEVYGLTTAAGMWLTAAVGVAAGMGREASAILGSMFALVVLSTFGRISRWIEMVTRKSDFGSGKASAEREFIGNLHWHRHRYVRRDDTGQWEENDNAGRSFEQDRKTQEHNHPKSGEGEKADRESSQSD